MESELEIQKREKAEKCARIRQHFDNLDPETRVRYRELLDEFNPDYRKKYYAENKEAIMAQHKEYNAANKDAINAQRKVYRANHREKECAKSRKYRLNNSEKVKESKKTYASAPVVCECGKTVTKGGLSEHKRSQIHNKLLGKTEDSVADDQLQAHWQNFLQLIQYYRVQKKRK